MPPRLLLLAAGLVVVVLGAVFFLLDGPPAADSASPGLSGREPAAAATPGGMSLTARGPAEEIPRPSPAQLALPAAPSGETEARTVLLAEPTPTGRVRGLLLTSEGAPVVGEPVDLLVGADPWAADGEDAERLVLADRTHSDAEGRFALAARAGVPHLLLAGGTRFARVAIADVRAGDELTLRLEPARGLRGVVREPDGTPVPEAHVAVLDAPQQMLTRSDAEGAFFFAPLGSGPVRVAAFREGVGLGAVERAVPDWEDIEIVLEPARDLIVRVTSRDGDAPIEGVRVTVQVDLLSRVASDPDPLVARQVLSSVEGLTDSEGRVIFAAQPQAGFVLRLEAEGFLSLEFDRHRTRPVREGQEVAVRLRPLGSLAARVLDGESGAPAPGARVHLLDETRAVRGTAESGPDGRLAFELAAWGGEGRPELFAEDDAGRTARVLPPREALDDPEAEIELLLLPALALQVQVVDGEQPVPGAQVCVLSLSLPLARTLALTGSDGLAVFEHRLIGSSTEVLLLQARSGNRASLALDLPLDGSRDPGALLVLDLAAGVYAEGLVLDELGLALPGVRVAGHGHSDSEGLFRAGPFPEEGLTRLAFSAEGYRQTSVSTEVPVRDLVVTMQPIVRWEGRVRDGVTQQPVPRYRVYLEREVVSENERVFRDVETRRVNDPTAPENFSVDLPGEGRYRLRVVVRDCLPAFSFAADFDGVHPPAFADVFVWPAAVARLTVLDADGHPVPGLAISLVSWTAARAAPRPTRNLLQRTPTGRTDEAGRVRLALGLGGSFRVAAGRGAWMDAMRFDVAPGPVVERTYRIGPSGRLVVRATDAAGRPAESVGITLRSRGRDAVHSVSRAGGSTDAAGELRLEGLPPGVYTVTARHRSLVAAPQVVTIAPRHTAYLGLALQPAPPPTPPAAGQGSAAPRPAAGAGGRRGG